MVDRIKIGDFLRNLRNEKDLTQEELAEKFVLYGGKHLYIDEIHKYKGWSTEIKNIYDKMPDLHVVYSGSSILDLEKGERAVTVEFVER